MHKVPEKKLYESVCDRCNGTDIVRDAQAIFDNVTQQWMLLSVYDSAICLQCGGKHYHMEEI